MALEGAVRLRVRIASDGTPLNVGLAASSGHVSLDQAALDAVRQWTFIPATRDGKPVEGWLEVPIVFRLEAVRPPEQPPDTR